MANIFGRQVILPLVNKSGGQVIAGDVVIIDTANDSAFTTTTSAAFTGGVGVAQETIASNATGRVLLAGYAALVNVSASVTRGQYGTTHTVAKQAVGTASRGAGVFAQWLTGGTTPIARIFSPDLAAAAGNVASDAIWDAAGDLAVGSGADTAVRLAKGSAGATLAMLNGALSWNAGTSFPGSPATNDRYYRTDLGSSYHYDGTRWVSDELRTLTITSLDTNSPFTTDGMHLFGSIPGTPTSLYLVDYLQSILITGTNSGSAYWTLTLKYRDSTNADNSLTGTITVDTSTDANGTLMVRKSVAVNQVLSTNARAIGAVLTHTGSPSGNVYLPAGFVTYRHIAT